MTFAVLTFAGVLDIARHRTYGILRVLVTVGVRKLLVHTNTSHDIFVHVGPTGSCSYTATDFDFNGNVFKRELCLLVRLQIEQVEFRSVVE